MTDHLLHSVKDYRINDKRVDSFIERNPELRPLLLTAYLQIQHYFPQTQCRLEYYLDPETAHEQLILYIDTPLDFELVLDKLDQFKQDWWLDNLHRAELKLSIIPEYL